MLNKCTLIGRTGKDPETKYTPSGTQLVNFSLATTQKFKKDGQATEKTEWHSCVAWGKLAEIVAQYVKKGDLIYVEGRIETQSWEKDGAKQHRTQIIVDELKMLVGRHE